MEFHLERIELENFRCFSSSTLTFEENLTVLIADNGSGKSATLDAIAVCLGQLLGPAQAKAKADRVQIVPSDARATVALSPYRDSKFPVCISAEAVIDDERTSWSGLLENPNREPQWKIPAETKAVASTRTRNRGADVTLPVFAYYGTDRTTASVIHAKSPTGGFFDRGFGYRNSLSAGGSLGELGPWLAQGESERSHAKSSVWSAALDSVYEAAAQVLRSHGVRRVSYSRADRDLVLDFGRLSTNVESGVFEPLDRGAAVIPMRLIADGYRSILGLVADLAFRCGVLNNHLEGEAPQLTSGVVLIDEIDMHLHPSWQTHVLDDLEQAFPRIQFIVTTHSPFVLSSVRGECVRQIEKGIGGSIFSAPGRATEGARIDRLAESLFVTPARAESPLTEMLEGLAHALHNRNLGEAEEWAVAIEASERAIDDPDAIVLLNEFRWRQQRGHI